MFGTAEVIGSLSELRAHFNEDSVRADDWICEKWVGDIEICEVAGEKFRVGCWLLVKKVCFLLKKVGFTLLFGAVHA
ncbi:MAG: hypothetical protein ACKO2P_04305 [Planctomycetota bacterium]